MRRRFPELHNADTMQFLAERLTASQVATLLGCSQPAVSNSWSKMRIKPVLVPGKGPITKYGVLRDKTVMQILSQNFTSNEIAKIVGCSISRVCVACRRFRISCIRKEKPGVQITYNPDQLDESISHYMERQKCWHKLARKMLDNEWNGEWCK